MLGCGFQADGQSQGLVGSNDDGRGGTPAKISTTASVPAIIALPSRSLSMSNTYTASAIPQLPFFFPRLVLVSLFTYFPTQLSLWLVALWLVSFFRADFSSLRRGFLV